MRVPDRPLRYLLDQNFPLHVVRAVTPFMPPSISLFHVAEIDRRLS